MCAVLSSVCATTVDNSGVYVSYLKGIVSMCNGHNAFQIMDARLGLWIPVEHAFSSSGGGGGGGDGGSISSS